MSKYLELKNQKISTVGKFIEKLSKYPLDIKLKSRDADIGGYDFSTGPYIVIFEDLTNNKISFGHLENEAYEAYENKEITKEEFNEIVEEINE